MEYDQELINILYSCKKAKQLYEVVDILKNEYVLSKDELKLCNECIREMERFNTTNLKKKVTPDTVLSEYSCLDIDSKIKEFVDDRKLSEHIEMFGIERGDPYSTINMDLYLSGWAKRTIPSINTDIFNEEIFGDDSREVSISTVSEKIDEFSLGLKDGYITTIVGDDGYFKSLWAINIAYQAIKEDKNVMYLSVGVNKEYVAKRLLTRHSCEERFPRELSYEGMHNAANARYRSNVVLDFQDMLSKKIVVFDDGDLGIPSIGSLKRLIMQAYKHFLEETDSGIDLIIIDDLTYLSYYNGKRITGDRKTVINEYYRFLKDNSNDLLSTGHTCSILCTHKDVDDGITAAKNNGNYQLAMIPKPIVFCSDNILTIYGSVLNSQTKAKLKVIKSVYGEVMDTARTVAIDYPRWYMSSDAKSISENKYLKELNDYKIKSLESIVDKLTEERESREKLLDQYRKHEHKDDGLGSIDYIPPSCEGIVTEEEALKLRYELDKNYDETPTDRSNGGSMCS